MSGCALLLTVGMLFAGSQEPKPRMTDLRVDLEGREISVSFGLDNAFDAELKARIQSGLPSGYTFEIGLYRDSRIWRLWNRRLQRTTLEVSAMYDAVTREYQINFKQDGKLIETRLVRELTELEQAMTRFEEIHAFSLGEKLGKRRLFVKVRAALGPGTVLFFFPSTRHTPWLESPKFRPPEALP